MFFFICLFIYLFIYFYFTYFTLVQKLPYVQKRFRAKVTLRAYLTLRAKSPISYGLLPFFKNVKNVYLNKDCSLKISCMFYLLYC